MAVLDDELPPAEGWAARVGWRLSFDRDGLILDAHCLHPADKKPLLLTAEVDSYRALPPAWRFVDPETRVATPAATPSRDPVGSRSSVIHSVGVICAHFSRTAYKEYKDNAPHGGTWTLAHWAQVREGVQAHTIAEMLAVIEQHLRWSKGRVG